MLPEDLRTGGMTDQATLSSSFSPGAAAKALNTWPRFCDTIFNALHHANLHDGIVENRQWFASHGALACS